MKALLSVKPGDPTTLAISDIPVPQPGKGQLRVRVKACGINYPDLLVIEDKYQFKPPRPFAPGCEISGFVDAIGEGATGWQVGDRLLAMLGSDGGLAEYAIVDAGNAIGLPDQLDLLQGAALLFTYGTTIHALADRGRLKPGETLLVLGAAGGVGLAAVEIGKAMGAEVVAAVSSEEKAAAAVEAGADRTMIYRRGPLDAESMRELARSFKEAVGPTGANVIYDPVGGCYSEPALRSIAWKGRFLVVGFPAGIASLPLNLPLLKSCDVCGVFWGGFIAREPDHNRRNLEKLLDWWTQGYICPRIDKVYPLDKGGQALARLASRTVIGKVVVCVDGQAPCDLAEGQL
ncbi:NADPH:quinone oxidoreductase family protein [Kineobactrum salinum]|uniref:NADPH:quinone oxidoreductase family protein n=1 Tax=Kineobactrum salinum TaxID=2708301 RepID=A0A6C0TZZ8_9GAMM|nr:NADPH:quinone oxidoreductase family protein [Kineobactrum salinum]QIB65103.1 NADPH:quinone oxidoreductase family protein [Kineobactrum salinum]